MGPKTDHRQDCQYGFPKAYVQEVSMIDPPPHNRHNTPTIDIVISVDRMDAVLGPGACLFASVVLPKLIAPPAAIILLDWLQKYPDLIPTSLASSSFLSLPQWLLAPSGLVISSLVGTIFPAVLSSAFQSPRERYEMWQLNAIRVPVVKGRLPGNFDVLQIMLQSFEEEYAVQFLEDNVEKYGHLFCLRFFGEGLIVTFNPNDIKRIMATDFSVWEKGEKFHDPTGRSGVFNSDGEMWKFHRNMTRPFFSRERITDFEIFKRHSDEAVELIKKRCSAGPFPQPGSTAEDTMDTENGFVKAFNAALSVVGKRLYAGALWRWFEFFEDKTRPHMKVIHDYLDPIVNDALKKREEKELEEREEKEEQEEGNTLLEDLVASTQAHAITAIFYFFATEDKKIFDRLRQEVLDVVGPTNPLPSVEDVKEMKYLRAVINATLRLMPSIPSNIRQANKSSVWVTGDGTRYYIPKGVT
ncbi:hypothetical protein FRB90_007160, partial [Tulasnella sp. 427]